MPAGSLTLFRRHSADCQHAHKGRQWTRCNCPISVQGSLGGRWIKESMNTRSWAAASAALHEWEAAGQIGGSKPPVEIVTVPEAVAKYLEDIEARHLAAETIRKRRELLKGKFLPFCQHKGYSLFTQVNVDVLRTFRRTWTYSPLSAMKRLEYLRVFFRFCHESGWLEKNIALAVQAPKVPPRQTLPFDDEEITRILGAAESLGTKGRYGPKIRAMVLLLQHSGLRIQDAACLERARLTDDKLFLYTQKTGTPVYCPLPSVVVDALNVVPPEHADYFFWDGRSQRESMVKSWDRVFGQVFAAADPPVTKGHPHRFRDTFAVNLLLKGVRLEQVSIILGHSSVKVTERYYAPWVKARQEQLEADVRQTWDAPSRTGRGPGRADTRAPQPTAARAARGTSASPVVA
jgi:integrase/recombinase XerD